MFKWAQWGSPTGWLTFLPSPSCSNQRRLLRWRVRWTRGWSAATLCQNRSASYEYRPWAPSHSRQRSACPERKARYGVRVKYASSCLEAWGERVNPFILLQACQCTFSQLFDSVIAPSTTANGQYEWCAAHTKYLLAVFRSQTYTGDISVQSCGVPLHAKHHI